jgi:hypothetical protein
MHNRELHHFWTKIRPYSYWYFFAAFIISALVAVVALRNNNLTAVSLRNNLYAVDKNNGDVTDSLNTLRKYVYSHMNTNLASGPNSIYPPIQLKYTYQRLVDAQKTQTSAINAQVYTNAESYCQQVIPNGFSGRYRAACIESYVTTHGATSQPIQPALYEFDFVSPFWSPDLAGWSLVISIVFFLLFVTRFVLEKWLNHRLKESA